jgi:hypothetical protein
MQATLLSNPSCLLKFPLCPDVANRPMDRGVCRGLVGILEKDGLRTSLHN